MYMEEEVWRDISLSSLHLPSESDSSSVNLALDQDFSVQDLLSCPPPPPHSRLTSKEDTTKTRTDQVHCSTERSHHPSTVVVEPHNDAAATDDDGLLRESQLDAFGEFPVLCNKKRNPESDDSASDHRKKRQMKNRESAARSRARKQAYTTGLEVKVSRLAEENGRLRRQLEKLCTAAVSVQCPKKHTLQRTLTAPF